MSQASCLKRKVSCTLRIVVSDIFNGYLPGLHHLAQRCIRGSKPMDGRRQRRDFATGNPACKAFEGGRQRCLWQEINSDKAAQNTKTCVTNSATVVSFLSYCARFGFRNIKLKLTCKKHLGAPALCVLGSRYRALKARPPGRQAEVWQATP